jgi:hypothetical protein
MLADEPLRLLGALLDLLRVLAAGLIVDHVGHLVDGVLDLVGVLVG